MNLGIIQYLETAPRWFLSLYFFPSRLLATFTLFLSSTGLKGIVDLSREELYDCGNELIGRAKE